MEPWIDDIRASIYSIMALIEKNNILCSKIRVGCVAFRDIHEQKRFEIIDFTEDIGSIYDLFLKLKARNGMDMAEDITGGLIEGLKLSWESEARYAILITDTTDHGGWIEFDKYPKGLYGNNLILFEKITEYAYLNVNFFAGKLIRLLIECLRRCLKFIKK